MGKRERKREIERERACCFAGDCCVALPSGAMDLSAVCEYVIS